MLSARGRALVVLIVFSLTLTASASSVRAHSPSPSPGQAVSEAARTRAEQLTVDLIQLNAQYQLAGGTQKARLESDLIAAARAREQALLALIDGDTAEVLRLALSGTVRSSLPASVRDRVEEEIDVEGALEILHEDRYDGSRYDYGLKTAIGKLSLHFAGAAPTHLLTGARVRAHGIRVAGTLALASGGTSVQTVSAASLPNSLGEQRTLVILVTFSDNPAQPYTPDLARNVMFGTTSNFFAENSFGQTWLAGDVAGWFTIATTSTICDTSAIAIQARTAAAAAGIDLAAYAHYVYAFPQNYACSFWGRSTVGGSPSEAWITGTFALGVTAHEFGHGMGLWHSHSIECNTTTLCSSSTMYEYGDTLDMMGAPPPPQSAHFNAFQKERLGWLNSGASPPITTVLTEGTYTLEAYELAGAGPKALKILKSTDPATGQRTWYYVESRQAIGFDGFLATTTNARNGVLVHVGTESNGNSSYLLDMTPASGASIYSDWGDPALLVGQSFQDSETGITLTTEWVTETAAAVTVRFEEAVTASTNQSSYTRNQSVSVTAKVSSGGNPVANAAVSFTITKANGAAVAATVMTGSNGSAVYKLRLKQQDPVGLYQALAVATSRTLSRSAGTSFTVR